MDAKRTNRIWLIGGMVSIVILVVAAWLLAISPKFTEADEVQASADDSVIQLAALRKEVAALKDLSTKKATYQAQLDTLVTNLPETYGIPDFLRALQDSGEAVDVKVTTLSVGSAAASGTLATAAEIPLSINVMGTTDNISKFLVRLQEVQSRAVRIDSLNVSGGDDATAETEISADLTLTAFCTKSALTDSAKADRTDMCATS